MSVLKDKRCYLSGPIEFGDGPDWRTEPKHILTDEFGISVFDPFADPKQQWAPSLKEAKAKKDLKTIVDVCHQFVRKDLCMVDRSDMLIAYLPHKVPTTGTVHEIIISNNSKKPTLLVTNLEDITFIPLWYFGFIPTEFMFAGWSSLYDYLRKIGGEEKLHDRWDFILGKI